MSIAGSPVSTTRMELLEREAQIALASQGRDLLEQKRTALMKELLKTVDMVMERAEALQDAAARAHEALARAEAVAGVEAVEAASLAARSDLPLEVRTTTVMGVRVPDIEQRRVARPRSGRGYSYVGTSLTVDEAAEAFETEVYTIIRLAESELRLTRLAEEIQRTSRRLNALDHLLIPRLKAERDRIQTALDERERADHYRLKLMKRILERKRGVEKVR
ncbi:MAG: V-type ATP synthase subunit D [Anaerolineae bacterium]|nr:V-type ATP synthase subunit D [Anaerolineae bacterium]